MSGHEDLTALVAAYAAMTTAPGPFRLRREETYQRLLAPVLAERDELLAGLDYAWRLIDDARAQREVAFVIGVDIEPGDEEYQAAIDQWLVWLARYEAIEEALERCRATSQESAADDRAGRRETSYSALPMPGVPVWRPSW